MARIESQAVGGYYKTPTHLLPHIARQFATKCGVILDPCAGEGEALLALEPIVEHGGLCGVEVERGRAAQLTAALENRGKAYHRDAFCMQLGWQELSVDVLYLNPPYDTDSKYKRLEHRWLQRFGKALQAQGVLVFVVPHYALAASAVLLATRFEIQGIARFPSPDFEVFKQVVLFATVIPYPQHREDVDPDTLSGETRTDYEAIMRAAASVDHLPDLATMPGLELKPPRSWMRTPSFKDIDYATLATRYQPWVMQQGRVTVRSPVAPPALADVSFRQYPTALPPKPAHLAAGIASGVFDGVRLSPDDPATGLPDVLVKGCFDREYIPVEEKRNRDGEVVGVVEVQAPKLTVTALDLRTGTYHTLRSSVETCGTYDLAKATTADLLQWYSRGMLASLRAHCPVLHDPVRDGEPAVQAAVQRPLYAAQRTAVQAAIKLLGGVGVSLARRRGRAALLLGEIGAGKTTVSLTTMRSIGARSVLAFVPPHLLDGWAHQVREVFGTTATVHVLSDVSSVEAFAALPADKDTFRVALVTRETAKLTHAYADLEPLTGQARLVCSKCGEPAHRKAKGDFGRLRQTCAAQTYKAHNTTAELYDELYRVLAPMFPDDFGASKGMSSFFRQYVSSLRTLPDAPVRAKPYSTARLVQWGERFLDAYLADEVPNTDTVRAAQLWRHVLVALPVSFAVHVWESLSARVRAGTLAMTAAVRFAAQMAFAVAYARLTDPIAKSDLRESMLAAADPFLAVVRSYYGAASTSEAVLTRLCEGRVDEDYRTVYVRPDGESDGALVVSPKESWAAVAHGLRTSALWRTSKVCGEPLYAASPSPRRVSLAGYIAKHHPRLADALILDEAHELGTDGSAQERAGHKLASLGWPTLYLTGSIMNGYAASLFANFWAMSPAFRNEFDRNQLQAFVDRYGYRKRVVSTRDAETKAPVIYGTQSDRVERTERETGNAPGVLPLFILRHLLPVAVTLHKADLELGLPPCQEIPVAITPDAEALNSYLHLQHALVDEIKRTQFTEDAGKLWGALADLPSYLDRAAVDTGNAEGGTFTIRYPNDGRVVATAEPIYGRDDMSAKERWLVETVRSELAEGRRTMVLAYHVSVLPRLARLLERELGEPVAVLYSDKVPTAKREAWINTKVIKPGVRVLLANPTTIQTGLNNLVYFATQCWYENPACNPLVYRQAMGRIDRPGQTLPTRVYFAYYENTAQWLLRDLLARKVSVSMSTDGIDPESALSAAGVGADNALAALSVGRQLYQLLDR